MLFNSRYISVLLPLSRRSSANPEKSNSPMRCERIAGLGRHLANLNKDVSDTFAAQWFERSLDDSSIRRIGPDILPSLLSRRSNANSEKQIFLTCSCLQMFVIYSHNLPFSGCFRCCKLRQSLWVGYLDDTRQRGLVSYSCHLSAISPLLTNTALSGLVVYPARIAARVDEELTFMATENIASTPVSVSK